MMKSILYHKATFYSLVICFLSLLLSQCSNPITKPKEGFVYMEDKTFKLNGKDFYPMILNYGTELMMGNNMLWAKPSNTGYEDRNAKYTKEAARLKLKADLQMIKDLGFNTVRLYGIAEYKIKDNVISKFADIGRDTIFTVEGENLEKYLTALTDVFKILDEVGLKAIVLTKKIPDENAVADTHLSTLLTRFKDEKAILAWDFFNEPLYFDVPNRKKEEVYQIVKDWKKFSRRYAPNQLLTIGLTGVRFR